MHDWSYFFSLVVLILHILFCSWLVNLNSPRITLRLYLQVFCGDWKEYSKVFSFRGDSNWLGFSKVCRSLSLQLILLSFQSNAEIGSTETTLLFMIYNIKKIYYFIFGWTTHVKVWWNKWILMELVFTWDNRYCCYLLFLLLDFRHPQLDIKFQLVSAKRICVVFEVCNSI